MPNVYDQFDTPAKKNVYDQFDTDTTTRTNPAVSPADKPSEDNKIYYVGQTPPFTVTANKEPVGKHFTDDEIKQLVGNKPAPSIFDKDSDEVKRQQRAQNSLDLANFMVYDMPFNPLSNLLRATKGAIQTGTQGYDELQHGNALEGLSKTLEANLSIPFQLGMSTNLGGLGFQAGSEIANKLLPENVSKFQQPTTALTDRGRTAEIKQKEDDEIDRLSALKNPSEYDKSQLKALKTAHTQDAITNTYDMVLQLVAAHLGGKAFEGIKDRINPGDADFIKDQTQKTYTHFKDLGYTDKEIRDMTPNEATQALVKKNFKAKQDKLFADRFKNINPSNEVPPKDVSNVAQVGPEGTGVEKLTDLQPEINLNAEVDNKSDLAEKNNVVETSKENQPAPNELPKEEAPIPETPKVETPEEAPIQQTENKSQENLFGDNGQVLASRLPYINEFVNNSLSPIVKDLIKGGKNTIKGFVNLVAPTFGVDREARMIVDKTLGDQNKAATILDRASSEWENMLGKMNQHDQVAFIDRYKRGLPQQNEHLQLIADYIKGVDKTVYDELQKHNPSINWKENHLRVMWKKIPGAETEQGGFKGLFRRPLQGTKGMFKHSTLEDMSEGIQKGGIPYSYNPLTNFKASYADAYKFITANRMWDAAKDLGLRVFVRHGKDVPDGFVKLNDGIAKVYFKSKIDKVMTSPGEWYVDEGFGRLLNNHLSTDLIRTSDFGKGMMWIKNAYTATELSFSPYHFSFVSIASMAHQLGLGYQKILSSSLFVGDFGRVGQGIKDVLTSPAAPKIDYNIGRDALRLLTEDGFKNSEAGKSLLKQFPEAGHLIDLGFENGLTAKLQDEYKNKSVNAFKQAWNNQDPMGAMLFHALPSLNQIVMAPLFDHFIPNIKWGAFLKGLSDDLVTHAEDLKSGKITESQLASKNVTHVEDIFGEKNFDRFYWNRTFKSALQLLFRSVTWKQGTLHLFASAPFEQGKEFYDAAKEGRAPRLNRNLAFVLGLATIHTAMANAIQLAFGQGPTTSFKDLVAPKINKDGSRIQIMDYFKDAMSFAKNQVNYLTSSTSGEIGKLMELWQNKDFYGYEIVDPNAPISMKAWQAALHMAPLPFGIQQYLKTSGKPFEERASGLVGFNKAPKYITNTSAQNDIDELYDKRFGGGTKPYSQREIDQAKTDLRNLKKQNSPQFEDKLNDYVNKGLIDLKSNFVKELDKNSDVPQDVKMFQRLPAVDQGGVLKDHPEDIQKYLPYAQTDLFKNNPEFLDQLKPIMENLPAKQRVSLQRRIYKKIGRVIE